MIGLLDPALLLPRPGPDPSKAFRIEIDWIVAACRQYNIQLLPISVYWNDLWNTLGKSLEKTLDPEARRALQMLRSIGATHLPINTQVDAVTWLRGFRQLFDVNTLPGDWVSKMSEAVAIAAALDTKVVMFARRIEGRNLTIHRISNSTLDENLRWALYVQLPTLGPRQILCIYHARNLVEKWTCRYDWRLPADSDGGPFPFLPAMKWWKGTTVAFRTIESKYAWVDVEKNGWARPNINAGTGYHWDVFIHSLDKRTEFSSNHVNIVAFGGPPTEGVPGNVHH